MDCQRPSATCYLAEVFDPGCSATGRSTEVERIRRAAEQLASAGASVRHVRSLYIAREETALHVFVAEEPNAVEHALHDAGLEADRIEPVVEMADGSEAGQPAGWSSAQAQPRRR